MKHTLLFVVALSSSLASADSFLSHDEIARQMNETRVLGASFAHEVPAFETLFTPQEIKDHRAPESVAMDTLSDVVDLRAYDSSVKKQPNPHCTAYGMAAVMENWINHHLPQAPVSGDSDLSEQHIFSFYGQYSVTAAVKGTLGAKVTAEKWWPENNSRPVKGYLDHAHSSLTQIQELGNVEGALAALSRGNPVYVGLRVPAGMGNHDAVIGPDSAWTKGGHAVAIVGYQLDAKIKGGGYLIIKNSWGPNIGDHGYQYLNFDICRPEARPDMYCMFWEIQAVGHVSD